ncbi:MAG: RNA polymerase sigma factor [Ktedonobacterales bacterium]|nr:RNA polymerase sigma factor [Ktedonobacterales bacterium]
MDAVQQMPGLRWAQFQLALLPPATQAEVTAAHEATEQATRLRQFEAFFYAYERRITGYLCRMTGDDQTGLDLSQETFVQAWKHFDHLNVPAAAKAWLFRVATNLALRHIEQQKRFPRASWDESLPGASDPGSRVGLRDSVQRVLALLPPKQRSVLLLYEIQGLSCAEIGRLLGMSREAVKVALWRGRERFRSEYLREEAE